MSKNMSLVAPARSAEDRFSAYPTVEALTASFRETVLAAGGSETIVGSSVEGRPLLQFEVGATGGPVILFTALMHGNEVIGSLALLEVVRRLTAPDDAHTQRLLRQARFVIMPVVNPDAFAANMAHLGKGDRAWQRCNAHGVDLNRNFPKLTTKRLFHPFSGSRFHTSPYYAGPHAFSEPESRAVRAAALAAPPSLAIAFHSFGNLLLYPWAYTTRDNPRAAQYAELGRAMNQSLVRFPYAVHQARQLYSVLGDMDDWLDAELGSLSFTLEVSRPHFGLRELGHLLNPFGWMNPPRVPEVVGDVAPGVLSLVSSHLGYGATVRAPTPRRVHGLPGIELAAK
jgi:carboxypeptidase T